jgi:hypothetical protein
MEATTYAPGKGEWRQAEISVGLRQIRLSVYLITQTVKTSDALDLLHRRSRAFRVFTVSFSAATIDVIALFPYENVQQERRKA